MPETTDLPWLDRPDALDEIDRRLAAGSLSAEQAEDFRHWVERGYLIYEDLLPGDIAEAINADVMAIYEANKHLPIDELKELFVNVFADSEATRRAVCYAPLLEKLDTLLGAQARPNQTLNLPYSSQQATHSDQILFATHPPGNMVAAWFALEDIRPESGPLKIYPGSHRLPYVGAVDIGIPVGATQEVAGPIYDGRYYEAIAAVVEKHQLEPFTFLPKRGDVLLWHSNLLHGAHHTVEADATRQSLIAHYFSKGVVIYSDLWQRPCADPNLRDSG